MHINHIRHGVASIGDLHEDFKTLESWRKAPSSPTTSNQPFQGSLQVQDLSFRYPDASRDALSDVSLSIHAGECIGIAGPTGSGKSTLVDLMLGLLEPSRGRVTIDGRDLKEMLPEWQGQLGYVPQHIYLMDDSFVANVAFGVPQTQVDRTRVETALEGAQLGAFVRGLPNGIDTVIGERGTRLSGGERQRVGIARALYRDPSFVLFDEATSALDNRTERDVIQAVDALRGRKTLVLIAHRLSTIQKCDRIVFIQAGKLVASGSYERLLQECEGFRALVEASSQPD
jgi:ATP-binding cassette subfamily C protein